MYVSGCPDGMWGKDCRIHCPEHCSSSLCSPQDGTCYHCTDGYMGQYCHLKCMDHCIKCSQDTTCDGCEHGYSGKFCNVKCMDNCAACSQEQDACFECVSGVYGERCDKICPYTCEKYGCDRLTGQCKLVEIIELLYIDSMTRNMANFMLCVLCMTMGALGCLFFRKRRISPCRRTAPKYHIIN